MSAPILLPCNQKFKWQEHGRLQTRFKDIIFYTIWIVPYWIIKTRQISYHISGDFSCISMHIQYPTILYFLILIIYLLFINELQVCWLSIRHQFRSMDPAFPCINITSPTFVWRIFVEVWMRDIWFSWDFAFVSLAFSDEFQHNAALKKSQENQISLIQTSTNILHTKVGDVIFRQGKAGSIDRNWCLIDNQ